MVDDPVAIVVDDGDGAGVLSGFAELEQPAGSASTASSAPHATTRVLVTPDGVAAER